MHGAGNYRHPPVVAPAIQNNSTTSGSRIGQTEFTRHQQSKAASKQSTGAPTSVLYQSSSSQYMATNADSSAIMSTIGEQQGAKQAPVRRHYLQSAQQFIGRMTSNLRGHSNHHQHQQSQEGITSNQKHDDNKNNNNNNKQFLVHQQTHQNQLNFKSTQNYRQQQYQNQQQKINNPDSGQRYRHLLMQQAGHNQAGPASAELESRDDCKHDCEYTSQIRANQYQQRFLTSATSNPPPSSSCNTEMPSSERKLSAPEQPAATRKHHVNFNRPGHKSSVCGNSSSFAGLDQLQQNQVANNNNNNNNNNASADARIIPGEYSADDEEDGRKKKYLTAKYGQQQMNLIKKRLKIETWLYEQLQELAKGSKSSAELDDMDIDLDQLLDMEDDDTRRHWLKKSFEPFDDVPSEKVDKFIDEVLEQSKLL